MGSLLGPRAEILLKLHWDTSWECKIDSTGVAYQVGLGEGALCHSSVHLDQLGKKNIKTDVVSHSHVLSCS